MVAAYVIRLAHPNVSAPVPREHFAAGVVLLIETRRSWG
jgi:hypothetical protein